MWLYVTACTEQFSDSCTMTKYGDRSFAVSGPWWWSYQLHFDRTCRRILYTAENIFDDISYNACNSRHGTFAAFYSNLCHISDINNNNNNNNSKIPLINVKQDTSCTDRKDKR